MSVVITAQDGTSDTTDPYSIEGWSPTSESGNVVHEMIAPGTIVVTLVGDLPRSGSFTLLYDNPTDAEAGRLLLKRPSSFTLAVSDHSELAMTFVRVGGMSTTMHDQLRNVWTFGVGFQEIDP